MLNRSLLLLSFLLWSQSALAFELVLQPQTNDPSSIDVVAKNISPVYGADILIGYDSQFFDVVDQDDKKKGTQILKGDFFAEGAYLLDNRIDLRKGEIHYAIALVRPMDNASGDGVVASFKLKAKKSGATVVNIKKAAFGTQEGELLKVEPMQLNIVADASGVLTAASNNTSANADMPLSVETLLMVLIAILLIIVILLLLRKK